jgi:hypothetical protein
VCAGEKFFSKVKWYIRLILGRKYLNIAVYTGITVHWFSWIHTDIEVKCSNIRTNALYRCNNLLVNFKSNDQNVYAVYTL